MVSEARKRANEKYRKANVKQITVRFYPAEYDIYEFIKGEGKGSPYVKQLIRQAMENEQK